MIVYFLRHASAGQSKTNPTADAKRPLDKDGIEQSGSMGRALNAMDVQVDAIVSSPLKRASQTASLVGNEIGFDSKLTFSPALQPDATFEAFRDLLMKHAKQEAIMVVGHNPSLSRFLSLLLTGGANDRAIDMKKGAVARLDINGRWAAELTWCITPKIVRTIYDSSVANSRPKTSRK
jgi:phosphohistidine phosphatase